MTRETIFSKIIKEEIPCEIIYKDDKCIAFNDINPQAPIHILIIPKKPIESLSSLDKEDSALMGHLLLIVKQIAEDKQLKNWRTVINTGSESGQTVFHLHIHIIGGRKLSWPPG